MRRISFTKMFSAIIMLASVNSFIGCSDKDDNYDNDFETGIVVESESLNNCPDNNHPHMIDLGLPSGKLWSCCNVGAGSPEQFGNFYSWESISTELNAPNAENVKEFIEYTTRKWIKGNGVKGMKFTSKVNGHSIFMPASGIKFSDGIYNKKEEAGYYWTTSLSKYTSDRANNLLFVYKSINIQANPTKFGMNIRPVSKQ